MNELAGLLIRLIEILDKSTFVTEHGDKCELDYTDKLSLQEVREQASQLLVKSDADRKVDAARLADLTGNNVNR